VHPKWTCSGSVGKQFRAINGYMNTLRSLCETLENVARPVDTISHSDDSTAA